MNTIISSVIAIFFGLSVLAQAPVTLKLNLEKDKVYNIKSNSSQTVQQSVNGQQYTMEVTSNTSMNFKQIGKDNDVLLIEVKLDTIETIINSPMFKKETNSAKPAKSNEYFEKVMNRFSSFPLTAKISSSGKFMGFDNYKMFKAKVLEIMDSVPATQKDQVQKQADAFLRETTVQSMVEPFFSYLPEKTVKAGDQWESSYMQSSVQASMLFFNNFTLNSVENNTAKISGKSEIESVPSNEPVQADGKQMTTEAKGSSNSELTADLSTGLLSQGSITSHIEGTTTIKNEGNEMKVSFVVDSKMEITNK
jgi:hypothetical protein